MLNHYFSFPFLGHFYVRSNFINHNCMSSIFCNNVLYLEEPKRWEIRNKVESCGTYNSTTAHVNRLLRYIYELQVYQGVGRVADWDGWTTSGQM